MSAGGSLYQWQEGSLFIITHMIVFNICLGCIKLPCDRPNQPRGERVSFTAQLSPVKTLRALASQVKSVMVNTWQSGHHSHLCPQQTLLTDQSTVAVASSRQPLIIYHKAEPTGCIVAVSLHSPAVTSHLPPALDSLTVCQAEIQSHHNPQSCGCDITS